MAIENVLMNANKRFGADDPSVQPAIPIEEINDMSTMPIIPDMSNVMNTIESVRVTVDDFNQNIKPRLMSALDKIESINIPSSGGGFDLMSFIQNNTLIILVIGVAIYYFFIKDK